MSNLIKSLFFIFLTGTVVGQWQWTELSNMPFQTANNAVCEAIVNGNEYVYSFGGIDTTKNYAGIHQRSFKYDVTNDNWTEIDSLPDASGKIASGASFVKDRIYIFGGYHVLASQNEISSNKVHVYNPTTDLFEQDGTSIPIPIDDHVQCVYKDSLIYIVTGWSNTGNVPNVQIYDPSFDSWQVGTSTGGNAFYTSFGSSGHIIGDTLYYYGGAGGGAFLAKKFMRKGFINPTNPTDITWTLMPDAPGLPSYRAACSGTENSVFWVGGSSVSYNFDGIAYNGSGGVAPSARVLTFNNVVNDFSDEFPQPYGVMDLRGIAKLSNNRWIIAGGMDSNQVVMNRTFLLENPSVGLNENSFQGYTVKYLEGEVIVTLSKESSGQLIDMTGRVIKKFRTTSSFVISRTEFQTGIYRLIFDENSISIRL